MDGAQSPVDPLHRNICLLRDVFDRFTAFVRLVHQAAVTKAQFSHAAFEGVQAVFDLVLDSLVAKGEQFHRTVVQTGDLLSALAFAVVHDQIAGDLFGPSSKVGAGLKPIELTPHNDARLLEDVFGVGRIRGECKDERVEGLPAFEEVSLKRPVSLVYLFCRLNQCHALSTLENPLTPMWALTS